MGSYENVPISKYKQIYDIFIAIECLIFAIVFMFSSYKIIKIIEEKE